MKTKQKVIESFTSFSIFLLFLYFISRSLFIFILFFLHPLLVPHTNWHLHRKALSSKRREREKKISFYKGYCMYNPPLLQSVVKARLTHRGWCIWFIALGIVKMKRRKKYSTRKKYNIQSEWGERKKNLLKIEFESVLVYICYSWKGFLSLFRICIVAYMLI